MLYFILFYFILVDLILFYVVLFCIIPYFRKSPLAPLLPPLLPLLSTRAIDYGCSEPVIVLFHLISFCLDYSLSKAKSNFHTVRRGLYRGEESLSFSFASHFSLSCSSATHYYDADFASILHSYPTPKMFLACRAGLIDRSLCFVYFWRNDIFIISVLKMSLCRIYEGADCYLTICFLCLRDGIACASVRIFIPFVHWFWDLLADLLCFRGLGCWSI